jgi:hypothetical protein
MGMVMEVCMKYPGAAGIIPTGVFYSALQCNTPADGREADTPAGGREADTPAPAGYHNGHTSNGFLRYWGRGTWLGWPYLTPNQSKQPRPSTSPSQSVLAAGKNELLNRLPSKVRFFVFLTKFLYRKVASYSICRTKTKSETLL